MKPTDISQLIADLRNYQTTLDENVVICDRRVVDGSAEIMLALAAHIAMMEDRICTHPPAPDATRGDPVARVVEWLRNGGGTDISQLSGSTQMLFLKGMNRYADAIERGEPFNG